MSTELDQLYDLCRRTAPAVWLEIDGMYIRRRRVLEVVREMRRLPTAPSVRVEHRMLKFFYTRGYLAMRFYGEALDEHHRRQERHKQRDELARVWRVDRARELSVLPWRE